MDGTCVYDCQHRNQKYIPLGFVVTALQDRWPLCGSCIEIIENRRSWTARDRVPKLSAYQILDDRTLIVLFDYEDVQDGE